MQSLMGKERAIRAFDCKRRRARFFKLCCASLPIALPLAFAHASKGTADLGVLANSFLFGFMFYICSGNNEIDANLEILAKCVGRPRLAKALSDRHPEHMFRSTYDQLGRLTRLNSIQVRLLQDFFIADRWMTDEDRMAAVRLLHR